MEVKVCTRCKNLFQYIAGQCICPHCLRKEEDMFSKVKDFLRSNPGASMQQVNEETGVPVYTIERFIRAGRLEVSAHSPIGIPCQKCGQLIRTGKYCKQCTSQLTNELSQAANELREKLSANTQNTNAQMRFLNEQRIKRNTR